MYLVFSSGGQKYSLEMPHTLSCYSLKQIHTFLGPLEGSVTFSTFVPQDDQLLEDSKTLGDCGFTNQTARPQAPATVGLAFRINGMLCFVICEPLRIRDILFRGILQQEVFPALLVLFNFFLGLEIFS